MMKSLEIWNKLDSRCSSCADVDCCFTALNAWSLEGLEEPTLCLHARVYDDDDDDADDDDDVAVSAGKLEQPMRVKVEYKV